MKRSFDPAVLEMMDRPQPVSSELERDLQRLRQLNRWFGSYRLVSDFMQRWIKSGSRMRIVDLATGSGDIPRLLRSATCNTADRQETERQVPGNFLFRSKHSDMGLRPTLRRRPLFVSSPSFQR